MALTTAQLQALKADIAINTNTIPTGQPWTGGFAGMQVKAVPASADGNNAVAGWYSQQAAPTFTVWKINVAITAIGDAFNGTELGGLTTGNQTRLQTIAQYSAGGVNPSLADRRQFFDDVFSGAGGSNTRANLLNLWRRFATYAEKLFSTGTGTDLSPATCPYQGLVLTLADIDAARNS